MNDVTARPAARIVILSGTRGVGKSTVCVRTVKQARERGYTCGGIITVTRPGGALDVLDVQTGAARRLTVRSSETPVVVQGRFRLDPAILAWGNAALGRAVPCHLLVVDELGPLEFEGGQGWSTAFDVLHRIDYVLALVVVRPELVVEAQRRLPPGTTTVLSVARENRESLPAALAQILDAQMNWE